MAPRIGIVSSGRLEYDMKSMYYDEFYAMPAPYVDAVRRAGGIPVMIAPGGEDWRSILPMLDGIVITGGMDVDPGCYGGNAQHPQLTIIDRERDHTDLALMQEVIEKKDMPVLCICRGMQVLNVAMGGTLHEHVADTLSEDMHRDASGWWTTHDVQVEPDSRLAQVMQAQTINAYSGHHQAVKELAKGLQVTAVASDGVIEAITLPEHPWMVAVQWHPEITAATDPTQQRLFDGLVQAIGQSEI